jgi:branched-chain amino acid transport system ATP-binding protein
MNTVALRMQDLHVTRGPTPILRGLSLDVLQGERLAIIGPNGAGKSTLFNAISGAVSIAQGGVYFHDRSLRGMAVHEIRRMGVSRSFQTSQLFANMTVRDNLCCAVQGDLGGAWKLWQRMDLHQATQAHAHHLLQALGLAAVAESPAAQLSYAQQRALELGMALGPGVQVLLLDEPSAGMSRAETQAFMQTLNHVTQGLTVVMVEHDMEVVFGLADRVAVLVDGVVLAVDAPAAIRANSTVQKAYLGAAGDLSC